MLLLLVMMLLLGWYCLMLFGVGDDVTASDVWCLFDIGVGVDDFVVSEVWWCWYWCWC